ncbi:MAG: HAMP domain-containing sensor histidine kinase [Hyphomicrobiaceae bacterium]
MMTLTTRLIAAAVVWITIGLIIAGILLSAIFRSYVTTQFYDELHVHLEELQRLVHLESDGAKLDRHLSDPRYDVANSGYYWEVQKNRKVLARSPSLAGAMLRLPDYHPQDVKIHHHSVSGPTGTLLIAERAIWPSASGEPVHFLIGTDERHLNAVLRSFDRTMVLALAGFALAMIAATAALIAFALRPLSQLRMALAEVRSGHAQQLAGSFPQEVQPLVDELNALLVSTTKLVQRARTQAGNLAHGLKTSLAVLTDEAQALRAQGVPQAAETILTHCRRMQSHIDYQIARARAVAMRAVPGTIASVPKAVGDVVNALKRLHAERGLTFRVNLPDDLTVAVDPQDLNEIIANLIDNACIYSRTTVSIRHEAGTKPDKVVIIVEDDGNGLPPEAFEAVFVVGERWDSHKPGGGLGLTIVRDLVRLYGGDVSLDRSSLGGLEVALELPAPT